jgi:SAM-dependent methyltransferase
VTTAGRTLRPDASAEDYVDFYRQIGEAQLEEAYYGYHGYAVARYHLLLGLLKRHATAGEALLDVGCASGYYSVRYAEWGGRVTGTDVAEPSLELARKRAASAGVGERCTFVPGDLRNLPFAEHSFDVVLATEVLEHVREQRQALAELTRVLRPGGTLIVSSPGALDAVPFRRRIALRGAASAEEAGVTVERTGSNDSLAQAGIAHEPYFHDAFTLPGLRALLPPTLEVKRLTSLMYVPPRALGYGFLIAESIRRRLPGAKAAARPAEGDGPLDIPAPYAEAQSLMAWTRLLWRVPVLREAGVGVLLVGRRR